MDIFTWHASYKLAEDTAVQYKGDTGTEEDVHVVEDFAIGKFLVVIGPVDDDDRYEIQFTA